MRIRRFMVAALLVALVSLGAPGLGQAQEHSHDTHAAAADGHGGHSDHIGLGDADLGKILKPEEIRSDLAFFTFIVFVLLLAILWKFAWGPIVAGLEKREQSIAKNIADAQRQHDEAKQLLLDYERKLAGAADQVRGIIDEGRRDAEQLKQSILTEAKGLAEAERTRSLRDIDAATDAALQSLAERSAQLAVDLAGKIVHNSLNAKDHARLIQEAVAKFPTAAGSNN